METLKENHVYISPSFEKCLQSAFKIGNFMQGHPYVWDKGAPCPQIVSQKKLFYWWCVNVTLLMLRVSYVALRFGYVCANGAPLTTKIHVGFVLAFWLSGAALQLTHAYCRQELVTFTQQFLAYFKRFQDLYSNKSGNAVPLIIKSYPFITKQLVLSWYANVALLGATGAVMPGSPEFLTSLALNPETLPYWIIGVCVSFDLYVLMVVLCGAAPIMFALLGFHFVLKKSLPELIQDKAKFTRQHLRYPQVSLQEYHSLALLVKLDNVVYKIFLPAIQVTIGTMLVLCIYGCIRLDGMTAMVLGVVGINLSIVLILVFGIMASVHTQTTAICEEFRQRALKERLEKTTTFSKTKPLEKPQLRTLRPLVITIGSLFCIDKMQVVMMFEVIFSYAITMLLMDP